MSQVLNFPFQAAEDTGFFLRMRAFDHDSVLDILKKKKEKKNQTKENASG